MPKISSITARRILDSRGEWTIEATVKLGNRISATASVPQGKSTGSYEASYVTPDKAVKNIKTIISPKLKGLDIQNQKKIDETLIKLAGKNKSRLGANATLAVSFACARAAAASRKIALWQYIRRKTSLKIPRSQKPRLFINVINGGMHAGNNLKFQEYMIIPKAPNIEQAVSIGTKMYQALKDFLSLTRGPQAINIGDEGGFAPNFKDALEPFAVLKKVAARFGFQSKIDFGLDAAASNTNLSKQKLSALYQKMSKKYNLFYLEDPFDENDFKSFTTLKTLIGAKTKIVGDDLTVTNIERMKQAHEEKSINGIIIKPNQIGTLSETLEAVRMARYWKWLVVVSHRSGETNDDFISDLAWATGADGIKLGSPARGERILKYNRLLEIEHQKR
jgi:enolase